MTNPLQSLLSPFHHLGRRFWIRFLVACVLVLGIETWAEDAIESKDSGNVTESVFSLSRLYCAVIAAPRDPVPRVTTVVEIDPERDASAVSFHDICHQRDYLARLLTAIADQHPHLIVVDKFFSPSMCRAEVNDKLRNTMATIADTCPIVTGLRTPNDENFLERSLDLGIPVSRMAIVNVDPDTRKLPLKWELLPNKEAKSTAWYDTLSFVAAKTYEPKLLELHPRLRDLAREAAHPYVSFLKTSDFPCFAAGRLLGSKISSCAGNPAESDFALNGKIVVVGEINADYDEHHTVVGNIPGVYLQANFIEALLDDRYYRTVPWLDYAFGFLFVAGIDLILLIHHESLIKALALVVLLFGFEFSVLYLLIMHAKLYVNPLPVGLMAIVIKVLHGIYSKVQEHPAHKDLQNTAVASHDSDI